MLNIIEKLPLFLLATLREVQLHFAKTVLKDLGIKLIPGTKLCTSCRMLIQKKSKDVDEKEDVEQKEDAEQGDKENCAENGDEYNQNNVSEERERLNKTLNEMEISPLKLHALPHHSRHIEGKRKLSQVKDKIENSVATVLSLYQNILHESRADDLGTDLHQKAKDKLMSLIKEKMAVANRDE